MFEIEQGSSGNKTAHLPKRQYGSLGALSKVPLTYSPRPDRAV